MEKIEIILTNCIKEIKSGQSTLAECLNRYPARRPELEPLLKMALNIQEPPSFKLDYSDKQTGKAQLLRQIRTSPQKKFRSFADTFSFRLPERMVWARVTLSVLIAVILLSSLTGGTAFAAQGSLPGDFLYPVKKGTEDARLLIAGDHVAKAELNLEFAQTRLAEMNTLIYRSEERAELAVDGYQRNLEAFREQINTEADASVLTICLEQIQIQSNYCDNTIDANRTYPAAASRASNLVINQQVELLGILSQNDNLRAAQINLNIMQNRLQRAQITANSNQYRTMEQVLLQYRQFNQLGEQILMNAQAAGNHYADIENMSNQTLADYLIILDQIASQSPQEYQNNIEICKEQTLQFQTQTRFRYPEQAQSGKGPDGASEENGSGPGTGQGNQVKPQYQGGTDSSNGDNGNGSGDSGGSSSGGGNTDSGSGSGNSGGSSSGGGSTDSGSGSGDSGGSSSGGGNTDSGSGSGNSGGSSSGGGSTDSGSGSGDSGGSSSGGGSTDSGSGSGNSGGSSSGGGNTDSGSGSGNSGGSSSGGGSTDSGSGSGDSGGSSSGGGSTDSGSGSGDSGGSSSGGKSKRG